MNQLKTLRIFDNYVSAHVVKSMLESREIPSFLKDENTVTAWSNAIGGGIKLMVPEALFEQAEALLEEGEALAEQERATPGFWDEDTSQLDPSNRICIHCGSKNTRRKEDEKDAPFLKWLLGKYSRSLRSDTWHCFHCGEDF